MKEALTCICIRPSSGLASPHRANNLVPLRPRPTRPSSVPPIYLAVSLLAHVCRTKRPRNGVRGHHSGDC
jgi:hypothetical protein